MNDREFLICLHCRLTEVHGESELVDYMHKFRSIIHDYDPDKETPNDGRGESSLVELKKKLELDK